MNGPAWHAVFDSVELAGGAAREFRVHGVPGFALRVHAQLSAYLNACPHQGLPLNWRPHEFLSGDRQHIICANHGAVFDCFNGQCLAGPCAGAALASWPVRERDGRVEVSDPPRTAG